MDDILVVWESSAPSGDASVEEVASFDARGMRPVFGRGDHFGRHYNFHMDIWRTRKGRLFMRCWSRCNDVGGRSFEIKGVNVADIPPRDDKTGFQELWIPLAVRNAYASWIRAEW